MKILYVHGYNGDPYGKSFNNLKDVCDQKGYEIISLTYDETKIEETISKIYTVFDEENVDCIIGASYGGFIVMNCFDLPRIVVNPCLRPIDELPKIGISIDKIKDLEYYQKKITDYFDVDDFFMCIGVFCTEDEILGTKYKEIFGQSFATSKLIPGTHHITAESAKHIIDILV